MPSFAFIRPRLADWRGWLPLAAFPVAMFAALLALGGDRGYFYRGEGDVHSWNTGRTLTSAANLSLAHNFRLAERIWQYDDGGFGYNLYSRFPVGGYALTRLAILPFGSDLAEGLLAARVLMLTMFCGAATCAFLAVARIAGSRRVGFAAATLAFSGFYTVYYADGVFNEGVMDVFGAALVFHGMTVFVQEGRFRQLLVKTCAALAASGMACLRAAAAVHRVRIGRRGARALAPGGDFGAREGEGGANRANPQPIRRARRRRDSVRLGAFGVQYRQRVHGLRGGGLTALHFLVGV